MKLRERIQNIITSLGIMNAVLSIFVFSAIVLIIFVSHFVNNNPELPNIPRLVHFVMSIFMISILFLFYYSVLLRHYLKYDNFSIPILPNNTGSLEQKISNFIIVEKNIKELENEILNSEMRDDYREIFDSLHHTVHYLRNAAIDFSSNSDTSAFFANLRNALDKLANLIIVITRDDICSISVHEIHSGIETGDTLAIPHTNVLITDSNHIWTPENNKSIPLNQNSDFYQLWNNRHMDHVVVEDIIKKIEKGEQYHNISMKDLASMTISNRSFITVPVQAPDFLEDKMLNDRYGFVRIESPTPAVFNDKPELISIVSMFADALFLAIRSVKSIRSREDKY
jgi:hypothetical protein